MTMSCLFYFPFFTGGISGNHGAINNSPLLPAIVYAFSPMGGLPGMGSLLVLQGQYIFFTPGLPEPSCCSC
jgi:hypothetical protein